MRSENESKMSWNKECQKITAMCQGQQVTGTVESSRLKYGGKVQHLLILEKPIQLRWRAEPTDRLLIDEDKVVVDTV
jgi:hypothetical protein